MHHYLSPARARVSYDCYGSGPPLVLVHGSFSDHQTNWEHVRPLLEAAFRVYAIARRGRGQTDVTDNHELEDEVTDVVQLIRSIGEPVFLLGHSYGARVALDAAARIPERVAKLIIYEPPAPSLVTNDAVARLETFAQNGDFDGLAASFFGDTLQVPQADLSALRSSELWPPIVADAPASMHDLRALARHTVKSEALRQVRMPVLLQVGSESPRDFYLTDALCAALADVRVDELEGQAHEGMTTAPALYAESVTRFLAS
jgi:pimeloyl-ACP methyl ester carboxylesterase